MAAKKRNRLQAATANGDPPEPSRWAMVEDASGYTVDVILWDGVTPYTPPAGHHLVPESEAPPWKPEG